MQAKILTLLFVSIISTSIACAAETAKNQKYGVEQNKEPVQSDIARVCDEWTEARKSACKRFSKQLKEQYNMNGPFPLLEEPKDSVLQYRLATAETKAKKGEAFLICEKDTVQDPYRLSGIDDISVQDPKEKYLQPDDVRISTNGAPVKKLSDAERKKKTQSYVLLADGESDVQGKKGCMLEKDIEKKYGKGCIRPKGNGGSKEDPKTCKTGLTVLKGVPFSDEAVQSIKGAGIQCFKEDRGRVKKNQKTEIAERISLASYVLCSDDAEALKKATKDDRRKKDNDPDKDTVENLLEGEEAPKPVSQTSREFRTNVSTLIKYHIEEPENIRVLENILEESKGFGKAFLKEATAQEVKERIKDYKDQIERGPETRGHLVALYGGLCGLGEVKYCKARIRKAD